MALGTLQIDTNYVRQHESVDAYGNYELLLRCLRRALHTNKAVESDLISAEGVCWPVLLTLARRHDVVPLLGIGLQNVSGVPHRVQQWLENHCRSVVAQNLALASELNDLFELFEESRLTAVPFKGPVWTLALYGNLAARQIADLDIFIEKSQAAELFKLLMDRGYVLSEKSKAVPSEEIRLNYKDVELIHSQTSVRLELHWSACEPWFDQYLSSVNLWEPASTITLLKRQMPLPSPEQIFFLLALHGFRHEWDSLKWVCDIAAAIHTFSELNWNALLSHAEKLSRKRMVLVPLALVQQLFDMPLPDCVVEAIAQDQTVSVLAGQLAEKYCEASNTISASSNDPVGSISWRTDVVRIRSRESFTDRMGMLAGRFRPTMNDRQYILPRTLPDSLYWLVRPFRLLATYGPASLVQLTAQLIRGR
ncbi:nucleotidyltransferase domain-containing protein [Silvibacterium bohemicum]|nr:nucleotidyltransferase family protein [Silvibacterium bohemicum]